MDQLLRRTAAKQRNSQIEDGRGEPRDKRAAEHEPRSAAITQPVDDIAGDKLQNVRRRGPRAPDLKKKLNILPVYHHAAQHEMRRERRAQVAKMPAQSAPVILPDIEHPTSVDGAHLLRMVVRRNRAQVIGKLGMRLEEGQCLCRMVDKGSSEVAGRGIADDIVKVAQHLFATVLHPGSLRLGGKRKVHRCSGERGCPAEAAILLQDDDIEAIDAGRNRGRERRGSGADDDDVRARRETWFTCHLMSAPPRAWLWPIPRPVASRAAEGRR